MKTIQLFLGGGVKLLHGEGADLSGYRNEVIDPVISQLNSTEHSKSLFIAKDYSDLPRNVVKGGTQETVYNHYIRKEADVALFILDGAVGAVTKQEIDVAVKSTMKTKHPLVYIYGIDINIKEELKDYLDHEGVYYQHFITKGELAGKIKDDLIASEHKITKRRIIRWMQSLLITLMLSVCIVAFVRHNRNVNIDVISQCSAQLYLMRYKDVNIKADTTIFDKETLLQFKYDDSVLEGNDRYVYPIYNDSTITSSVPVFRLKLNNKHRNTIVLVEAFLEIDNYRHNANECGKCFEQSIVEIPNVYTVQVDTVSNDYLLKGFRQSIAYGEIDDRYAFAVNAKEDCSFRMRVRAKAQTGEYLYSNYICLDFKK